MSYITSNFLRQYDSDSWSSRNLNPVYSHVHITDAFLFPLGWVFIYLPYGFSRVYLAQAQLCLTYRGLSVKRESVGNGLIISQVNSTMHRASLTSHSAQCLRIIYEKRIDCFLDRYSIKLTSAELNCMLTKQQQKYPVSIHPLFCVHMGRKLKKRR